MVFVVALFGFLFGAAIGSFLNVVIYRLPRGESLVSPGSACPQCKTPIAAHDNIPIVSWILLRGKCRTCHEPISWRYPLIEAVTGLVGALIFLMIFAIL